MRVVCAFLLSWSCANAFGAVTPFELPWMNSEPAGQTFNSASYPDGVFVVEAYFLDCPYCNDNAPAVNDLAESYSSQARVHVLDVGIDRRDEQYATWIRRHRPNHPVLKDSARKLIKQLGVGGYPSTFVLDCKGNIVFSTSGKWSANAQRKIKNAIDETLNVDCR